MATPVPNTVSNQSAAVQMSIWKVWHITDVVARSVGLSLSVSDVMTMWNYR